MQCIWFCFMVMYLKEPENRFNGIEAYYSYIISSTLWRNNTCITGLSNFCFTSAFAWLDLRYETGERISIFMETLQWRHNGRDSVSNHQPHHCLLDGLFRRRSKKTWKLRVTGLCARNSPVTGEMPAQMASNAESVFIWWRHHEKKSMHLANWVIEWRMYASAK